MYAATHFTDLGRIESWVNFSGKGGHTDIQPSTRPGIGPGTFGLGGKDLTTAPTPLSLCCHSRGALSFEYDDYPSVHLNSLPGGLYHGRPVPAVLPLGAVLLVVHWSCGSLPLRCTCVQRGDQASLSVRLWMGWGNSDTNGAIGQRFLWREDLVRISKSFQSW